MSRLPSREAKAAALLRSYIMSAATKRRLNRLLGDPDGREEALEILREARMRELDVAKAIGSSFLGACSDVQAAFFDELAHLLKEMASKLEASVKAGRKR